jgi:outer membrane protein assembly factor BamD
MRLKMMRLNLFLVATFCLALTACSDKTEGPYVERSVGDLYNEAHTLLDEGKYEAAANAFDEVERQHPYSKWASKAQMMAGYAHYRGQKYDRAIPAFEAFTQLHPAHEDVPYALYMTGLSYYEQLGPSTRDQTDTYDALRVFQELIRRFPATPYGRDARLKVILLKDALAGKEMEIGRYYLKKNAYQAAIPRFQVVAKEFDTTKHVEEALYRQVECYVGLGLMTEAKKVAAVLGHNYQGSAWYVEAYNLVGGEAPAEDSKVFVDTKNETFMDRLRNWNKGLPEKGAAKNVEKDVTQ